MTKNEALAQFKATYPNFKNALKMDYIAVRTEWGIFTDYLCRDGIITEKQYNNWLFPFKRV